jgi:RimJ/RimL family protein N-acetyltransferase
MLLSGKTIQLLPYTKENWVYLQKWYFDPAYGALFRQHSKAMSQAEFECFPQLIGGDVFLVYNKAGSEVIGLAYVVPSNKPNRAFYTALLIDSQYQHTGLHTEILIVLLNYAFNRVGYRKAIFEILKSESHLSNSLMKHGCFLEGTMKQDCFFDGKFQDELRFCILAGDFNKLYKETAKQWAEH